MSALLDIEGLTEVAPGLMVRDMLTIGDAIGLWLGDLARSGKAQRTRDTYGRTLDKFADTLPHHWDVAKIGPDECRRFLDHYLAHAKNTRAQVESILNGFFEWLRLNDQVKRNPMDKIPRTRKPNSDSLDVISVSTEDVRAMLHAAVTWTERLSVAIPAYTGCRRHAAATLRVRDYDRRRGMLRFHEKGDKTVWKPVPNALRELLEARLSACETLFLDDYLIPNESSQRVPDRDDRVIWAAVRRVAERAGVRSHVHALRAAFATFYLEQNPGDLEALQPLMGHASLGTTQVYLRRLKREVAMERVRDLTWA